MLQKIHFNHKQKRDRFMLGGNGPTEPTEPTDQPYEQLTDQPYELVTEQSSELVTDEATDQPYEQLTGQSSEQSSDEATGQPSDKSADLPSIVEKVSTDSIHPRISPFSYLSDNLLQQWFYFCKKPDNNAEPPKYKIKICMYGLNRILRNKNTEIPFLQFLMKLNTDSSAYTFPEFEYECVSTNDESDESDEDETINAHFLNECFTKILEILNADSIIHEKNIHIRDLYKGLVEMDEYICVVFDCTHFIETPIPNQTNTWAIIDELLYKRSIFETAVDNTITEFFEKNPYMSYIKNEKSPGLEGVEDAAKHSRRSTNKYDFPFQMYLCKWNESGEYENVVEMDTMVPGPVPDDSKQTPSTSVYSSLPIQHPIFGSAYYFSSTILSANHVPKNRYAVFVENPMYILKNISDLDENTILENMEKISVASSIYFHENNPPKNNGAIVSESAALLDESETTPSTNVYGVKSLTSDFVYGSLQTGPEQGQEQEQELSPINREIADAETKTIQLWCIKSNNHFVQL
jgi:hypothetical protein